MKVVFIKSQNIALLYCIIPKILSICYTVLFLRHPVFFYNNAVKLLNGYLNRIRRRNLFIDCYEWLLIVTFQWTHVTPIHTHALTVEHAAKRMDWNSIAIVQVHI